MRIIKTALVGGAVLQAGGLVALGISQWDTGRSLNRFRGPDGLSLRTLPQPCRKDLRSSSSPPPFVTQSVAQRYLHDRTFREAMAQQQSVLASTMEPGTKSIGELAHTVLKKPPAIEANQTVVLFAMFTNDGKLSDHARYYIDCLQSSFDHVIGVVATDAPFSQVDVALAEPFSGVVLRENHGLDFAGWSLTMRLWPEVWQSKQILFTNDSLFGPLNRAQWDRTVQRINSSKKDFIGLVESFSGLDPAEEEASSTVAWHYQSYFFALKNRALRSDQVQSFWYDHIYSLPDKADIIRDYEVGMTVQMRAYGMRTEALFSTIKDRPLDNPSIAAAKELLDRGFNFIKREFWRNPVVAPYIAKIDLEQAARDYPVKLPALPHASGCPAEATVATLNGPHGSAASTPRLDFVDEVRWASPNELVVRGWTLAPSLNFVTDSGFSRVRLVTQQRPDVAAATGDSNALCSGFEAHLGRNDSTILPQKELKLSVFAQLGDGEECRLVNVQTAAIDGPVLPPVTLRYDVCDAGLSNQVYAHLAAWTLANALHADVHLFPARTRSSFGHYNVDATTVDPASRPIAWSSMPLAALLDTNHIIKTAQAHGLRMYSDAAEPANAAGDVAFADRPIPQRQLTLSDAVTEVQTAVAHHVSTRAASHEQAPSNITVDLPCPFLWVADLWKDPFAVDMARSLRFPPHIAALANRTIEAIHRLDGGDSFSGIHLRLEEDARASIDAAGGQEHYWQTYVNASRDAHFDPTAPIYVSSGLLSYGKSAIVDRFTHELRGLGYNGSVTNKEQLLPREELDTLAPETQAVLDLAVMLPAQKLVGTKWSSFSILLEQLRGLQGREPDATVLSGTLSHPEGYFRLIPQA